MDTYQIAQLIALALAIAVLVILIVVLTRNTLSKALPVDAAPTAETMEGQIIMLDNKVNWLYGLEIASTGVMVLFGLIGFFGWMRFKTYSA
jgi:hypothetical protein